MTNLETPNTTQEELIKFIRHILCMGTADFIMVSNLKEDRIKTLYHVAKYAQELIFERMDVMIVRPVRYAGKEISLFSMLKKKSIELVSCFEILRILKVIDTRESNQRSLGKDLLGVTL
jgi:hypothetical protein